MKTDKLIVQDAKSVEFKGSTIEYNDEGKFMLPSGTSFADGARYLLEAAKFFDSVAEFDFRLTGFPLDAAAAVVRAVKRLFGGYTGKPKILETPTGANTTLSIPFGSIKVAGLPDGYIDTSGIDYDPELNLPVLTIAGACKNRDMHKVEALKMLAREELQSSSLYRGQPLQVKFPNFKKGEPIGSPLDYAPRFIDVSGVTKSSVIFRRETEELLEDGLFSLIEKLDEAQAVGVGCKRGVLLAGPPGVGKSLLARVLAKRATAAGWTFIQLGSPEDLKTGLALARLYQPAILFCEDVEAALGDRSVAANILSNAVDGVSNKSDKIIFVFTSNFPEQIDPVFKRSGRMDLMLKILPPDADAVDRLIKLYGKGKLAPTADLTRSSRMLEGLPPSDVKEAVELSLLSMIRRGGKLLNGTDLERGAALVLSQKELRTLKQEREPSELERAAQIVADSMSRKPQPQPLLPLTASPKEDDDEIALNSR